MAEASDVPIGGGDQNWIIKREWNSGSMLMLIIWLCEHDVC